MESRINAFALGMNSSSRLYVESFHSALDFGSGTVDW